MTVKIQVFSDFVCPFCFIGETPLKQAAEGKDVEIEFMPFELRPYPEEPMSPNSSYIKQSFERSVKPLADRFGVEMDMPFHLDPVPHTHLAHQGYQFAKENGKAEAYVDAVFKAYWQKGINIGDAVELTEIAREIGLNEKAFNEALAEGTYKPEHKEAIRIAYEEAGVQAVPTFIVGGQKLEGLHSKEAIEDAIEEESAGLGEGASCGPDGC